MRRTTGLSVYVCVCVGPAVTGNPYVAECVWCVETVALVALSPRHRSANSRVESVTLLREIVYL